MSQCRASANTWSMYQHSGAGTYEDEVAVVCDSSRGTGCLLLSGDQAAWPHPLPQEGCCVLAPMKMMRTASRRSPHCKALVLRQAPPTRPETQKPRRRGPVGGVRYPEGPSWYWGSIWGRWGALGPRNSGAAALRATPGRCGRGRRNLLGTRRALAWRVPIATAAEGLRVQSAQLPRQFAGEPNSCMGFRQPPPQPPQSMVHTSRRLVAQK